MGKDPIGAYVTITPYDLYSVQKEVAAVLAARAREGQPGRFIEVLSINDELTARIKFDSPVFAAEFKSACDRISNITVKVELLLGTTIYPIRN